MALQATDPRLAWVGERASAALGVDRALFNDALLDGATLQAIAPFFEGGALQLRVGEEGL